MQVVPDLAAVPLLKESTQVKEMLSISHGPRKTEVRINYSSLSVLQSCARKSNYLLERKLRSHVESPATVFGSAVHAALEVFYSEPREGRNLPANFRKVSDTLPYMQGTGAELEDSHFLYRAMWRFCEKAAPLRALPDSDKRSLANGVWLLQNYFETYIEDPYVVVCDEKGPITERLVEYPLYEDEHLRIIYFGTVDVILRNEQTGVILPTDHKTTSVMGNDFFSRLKPNAQYTGYLWLAQQVFKLKTDAFLVNGIGVKTRPVKATSQGPSFARQVTRRSVEDIEEFQQSVIEAVRNYLRWQASGVWPLGPVDVCSYWGGCSFIDVCSAPSVLRENIIENKFSGPVNANG